jgi:hypothetical protein
MGDTEKVLGEVLCPQEETIGLEVREMKYRVFMATSK